MYIRSSCTHPLLPTVIRGLLTRRVAPAPARQSFTLESNPRLPHSSHCHATPGDLSRSPLSTKEGLHRPIRGSPKVEHHREQRREIPSTSRTILASLTYDPALARVAGCTSSLCICHRCIFAPRKTPVSHAVEESWRRRRRYARGTDRHVSIHVLAGARRHARRRKPKAQASVLPMHDGCPSASGLGVRTRYIARRAVKPFDPVIGVPSQSRAPRMTMSNVRSATPNTPILLVIRSGFPRP